jgi:hypothetical protein
MSDLTEWLRAQLDEADQEVDFIHADDCPSVVVAYDDGTSQRMVGPCNCGVPQYLRTEVEAKRRILDQVVPDVRRMEERIGEEWSSGEPGNHDTSDALIRLLALPCADRPGYREEWRP